MSSDACYNVVLPGDLVSLVKDDEFPHWQEWGVGLVLTTRDNTNKFFVMWSGPNPFQKISWVAGENVRLIRSSEFDQDNTALLNYV